MNHLLVCVTETVSKAALDRMVEVYRHHSAGAKPSRRDIELQAAPAGHDR